MWTRNFLYGASGLTVSEKWAVVRASDTCAFAKVYVQMCTRSTLCKWRQKTHNRDTDKESLETKLGILLCFQHSFMSPIAWQQSCDHTIVRGNKVICDWTHFPMFHSTFWSRKTRGRVNLNPCRRFHHVLPREYESPSPRSLSRGTQEFVKHCFSDTGKRVCTFIKRVFVTKVGQCISILQYCPLWANVSTGPFCAMKSSRFRNSFPQISCISYLVNPSFFVPSIFQFFLSPLAGDFCHLQETWIRFQTCLPCSFVPTCSSLQQFINVWSPFSVLATPRAFFCTRSKTSSWPIHFFLAKSWPPKWTLFSIFPKFFRQVFLVLCIFLGIFMYLLPLPTISCIDYFASIPSFPQKDHLFFRHFPPPKQWKNWAASCLKRGDISFLIFSLCGAPWTCSTSTSIFFRR